MSAALMAAALVIALQPAPRAEIAPQPAAQFAPRSESIAFLVRFRGGGPIARAQTHAQRGDLQRAQRVIEAQLLRQDDFTDLCFDRFTAGAAEIVLRTCAPIAGTERDAAQQRWLARLRGMRAVAYADANVTVSANAE